MTTNDKSANPNTNSVDAGNAAAKNESTSSSKAAARKKQQQLKNQKSNPPSKKKQARVVKSTFQGIVSGVNPMKDIVIAHGNGNQSGQFRVFQKKLAGAAADDKAYGLDSAILELKAKVRSDFVKAKPNQNVYSTFNSRNRKRCCYWRQQINLLRSRSKRANGCRIQHGF
jgi:hypothetical protein